MTTPVTGASFCINSGGDLLWGPNLVAVEDESALTEPQKALLQEWEKMPVFPHPWVRHWGTIRDGRPSLWLSVEFVPDEDEEIEGEMQAFARRYGGILWPLSGDQFAVDIDVIGLPVAKREELLHQIVHEIKGSILEGHALEGYPYWVGVVSVC